MGEATPSENEWMIMEILWDSEAPMTAAEVIARLSGIKDVSSKTIRVLINRLLKKKIIGYTVDPHDARIYHYFAKKSREACLAEKSEHFIKSYFRGNPLGMVTAFVRNEHFSPEEIDELIRILEDGKNRRSKKNE